MVFAYATAVDKLLIVFPSIVLLPAVTLIPLVKDAGAEPIAALVIFEIVLLVILTVEALVLLIP